MTKSRSSRPRAATSRLGRLERVGFRQGLRFTPRDQRMGNLDPSRQRQTPPEYDAAVGLSLVAQNPLQHPPLPARASRPSTGSRVAPSSSAGWLASRRLHHAGGTSHRPTPAWLSSLGADRDPTFFTSESVKFEGSHYRINDLEALPRCVQQPSPPTVVGTGDPRMLDLARCFADIVGLQARPFSRPLPPGARDGCGRTAGWQLAMGGDVEAQIGSLEQSPAVVVSTAAGSAQKIRDCSERLGSATGTWGQDVEAAGRIVQQLRQCGCGVSTTSPAPSLGSCKHVCRTAVWRSADDGPWRNHFGASIRRISPRTRSLARAVQ